MTDNELYNIALLMVAHDVLKEVEHKAKSQERHKEELEKTGKLINEYLILCSQEEKKRVLEYYIMEKKTKEEK